MKQFIFAGLLLFLLACTPSSKNKGITHPQSFAFILQADSFKKNRNEMISELAKSKRDWIVIDYSFNGGRFGRWSVEEIKKIREAKPGRRILSYLSIGEAENYRKYWRPDWDANRDGKLDPGAPTFLTAVNPDWQGNYKVKYWDPRWQEIILRYIDEILEQDFDGVYLDIVDGYQFFEYDDQWEKWVKDKINPETKQTYRQDMMEWVQKIAAYAKAKKSGFLIVPQNCSELLADKDFAETIDAIGQEDLFTNGDQKQSQGHTQYILDHFAKLAKSKKPILLIEYPTQKILKNYVTEEAKKNNFALLITDRGLKTLGE